MLIRNLRGKELSEQLTLGLNLTMIYLNTPWEIHRTKCISKVRKHSSRLYILMCISHVFLLMSIFSFDFNAGFQHPIHACGKVYKPPQVAPYNSAAPSAAPRPKTSTTLQTIAPTNDELRLNHRIQGNAMHCKITKARGADKITIEKFVSARLFKTETVGLTMSLYYNLNKYTGDDQSYEVDIKGTHNSFRFYTIHIDVPIHMST